MASRPNSLTLTTNTPFDTATTLTLGGACPGYYHQCLAYSAAELEHAIQQVKELQGLPQGWDGEDGIQISAEAAGRTTRALFALACQVPVPEVIPNSNGTLTLEWSTRSGRANIEIGKTRFSGYVEAIGGPTGYFNGTNQDVGAFVGSVLHALLYQASDQSEPISNVGVVDAR
jgi:hypothetical protein